MSTSTPSLFSDSTKAYAHMCVHTHGLLLRPGLLIFDLKKQPAPSGVHALPDILALSPRPPQHLILL